VDFVKVLDFGLVKPVTGEHGPTEVALTGAYGARGTPAFMAPEQALGDRPLDPRADLYALGCLAYWLVTAKPVFKGSTPIDTMVKHVHASPDPPSRQTDVHVPPEFDDLVLACLSKNVEARPAGADAVAARLREIPNRGGWTAERARTWWDTHAPAQAS